MILYAQSIGNIVFKTWIDGKEKTCILKDVIHVPNLNRNLFSTSQGIQKGINIFHTKGGCRLLTISDVVINDIEKCGIY